MSSEITGREIELRRSVPYPEVPDGKRGGTGVVKVTDVLVYQGKVSEEQVSLALAAQKDNSQKDLGKLLLSLGFISGADLAQAQAERLGLEFVELSEGDVERDVADRPGGAGAPVLPRHRGRGWGAARRVAGQPVRHGDLTIALIEIAPYPYSYRPIGPGDYRATLGISR